MEKSQKKKVLTCFKQAQGMIKNVSEMLEADRYCIDTIQQSLAVIGFIKTANRVILENHLNCCFREGMLQKNKKKQEVLVKELISIMNKT